MNSITLDLTNSPELAAFFANRASGQVLTLKSIRIQVDEVNEKQVQAFIERVELPDESTKVEDPPEALTPNEDDLITQSML